jgi:hypothetical protein
VGQELLAAWGPDRSPTRHAASDGQELTLLELAASLWKRYDPVYISRESEQTLSRLLDPANPISLNNLMMPSRTFACWVNVTSKLIALKGFGKK